ncbi:MAG: hypothetical protein IPN56_01535 [Chitinophagaceae bacterium]|nr:hypothetical protein [Chitinophagaceae bacterium]MBK9463486.1 hypothetical protein [Chitinophagaceae bacterium]HQW43818.1 hypothetical protein [Chitinophagaceae bacterium]
MKNLLLTLCLFTTSKAMAFDTWWHAECTRKAMTGNGFSADARLAAQVSNYITDFHSAVLFGTGIPEKQRVEVFKLKQEMSYEYMHFDAIYSTADIEKNWQSIYVNTIQTLKKYNNNPDVKSGFRLIILFNIIGASLHIVQDFYSHSNWVNTYTLLNKSPIPTWYGEDSTYRKSLYLYTGAYPDGSAKGKKDHSELNKDCSSLPLNKEAVEVAERASIEWVKKIMEATPELPWGELKSYNIQGDAILKNFLVKLDATFLTSSSIVAGHLDGSKPAKFIFSAEKNLVKEQSMALAALNLTIGEYAAYLTLERNIYKIPSPYWAGFRVYFITRDMANGLSHSNKKYVKP